MKARRSLFLLAVLLAPLTAVAVACGGDEDPAAPVPPVDAAVDSAPVESSLSDATAADAAVPLVDAAAPRVTCAVTPCAVELAAGSHSVCARLDDGTVRCWGANTAGALGRGPDAGVVSPSAAPVVGLGGVTQLAGALSDPGDAYCARRADGSAACWGSNALGVLGRTRDGGAATTASSPTPAAVAGVTSCTGVFVGHSVACATRASSDVVCWGTNDTAQLPGLPLAPLPVRPALTFALPAAATQLAIADRGTVALAADGALRSWGVRGDPLGPGTGVLGREVSLAAALPGDLVLPHASAVAGSTGRVCAIANGRVYCWGVGPTPGSDSVYPTLVGIGSAVTIAQTLAVGPGTVCATLSDGTAQCWGNNAKGQLGNGNTDLQSLPVAVVGLAGAPVRLAALDGATCALLASGAVQCWGANTQGQLGLGTADALGHLVPMTVELSP